MMKNKLFLALIPLTFLISCCGDGRDKHYEIDQTYESSYVEGDMVYNVKTKVIRNTDAENVNEDEVIEEVYLSVVNKIVSSKIDSVLLHEKSLANMRVSEFMHLDDLTNTVDDK